MHRIDADRLANEVKLNVIALTRLTHAAANAMRTRKHGYILNVSSSASFQASPGLAVYSATKAYVTSFTEGVAMELRSSGIKVTALCPGLTKTEFQQNSNTTGAAASFPAFAWTSVSMVAKAGLEGVAKGKVIVVPGALYKVLVAISNSVPRAVSRKITQLITKRV
jgi:short-subunit dehydrogenase